LYYAARIYVHGNASKSSARSDRKNPQRDAFVEAKVFLEENSDALLPGILRLEKFHTQFLMEAGDEATLSKIWGDAVLHTSKYTAGDEKLAGYTAHTCGYLRKADKPEKIGTWEGELSGVTSTGLSITFDLRTVTSIAALQESTPVAQMVKERIHALKDVGGKRIVLVQDKYYTDNTARKALLDANQLFISGLNQSWHTELTSYLKYDVTEAGQHNAAYNKKTKESLVCFFDPNFSERRTVLSNAFKVKKNKVPSGMVPVYDHYAEAYNQCDQFNHVLSDRKFPFRRLGMRGPTNRSNTHHDHFYWDVCMLNVWYSWCDCNQEQDHAGIWVANTLSFADFCKELAVELAQKYSK